MRILFVANGYPPQASGGVETYTQTIAQVLAGRGHSVEVFCRVSDLRAPEYALRRESVEGIPVWRVVNDLTDATTFEKHYQNPRLDALFRQHLQAFQPDLIHFQHCLGLSATLLSVAEASGRPWLITLHDFWFFCPRATLFTSERQLCAGPQTGVDCVRCLGGIQLEHGGALLSLPMYKWLLYRLPRRLNTAARWTLEQSSQAAAASVPAPRHQRQMQARTDYLFERLGQARLRLVPSAFLQNMYAGQGMPPDKIEVLPLGIDLPRRPRAARPQGAGPVVAFIGSLQYHKGADVAVRAYRGLSAAAGELRLYGRGDPQDVFVDRLRSAAAGDARIRFLGAYAREALPDILAEIDLLIVPSRWHETYSLAAREALLAGVPVIATRMGALPDIIQDGVNGYLVAPGDANALAEALGQALARLEALKAGAAASAPAPTMAEHVNRLEEYYQGMLASTAAPA